jgi:cellulose synthase/poly-beta-1,6-N-acetylglucosamine synthase-like glycosyltransferase/peptidoglycan/xylan/chitin deacetylase (PgdA/CDA1 family)/spore germination protein YaaH
MPNPVFHDPSGRRGRWTASSLALMVLLVLATATLFAATIINVPIPSPLPMRFEGSGLHALAERIGLAHHKKAIANAGSWLPAGPAKGATVARQRIAGFYVPWEESSRASLQAHVSELDGVMPVFGFVTGPSHQLRVTNDRAFDAIVAGAARPPRVFPVFQNATGGEWDSAGFAGLLADPHARAHLLDQMAAMLAVRHAAGAVFDFEEFPAAYQPLYKRLLIEARSRFAAQGWSLGVTVPVGDAAWRLADYGRLADRVFLMLYDEHWSGGDPGPIASQPWFVARLDEAVREVGPDKAIVAIGNYGYDWTEGKKGAAALTAGDAWLVSHDSQAPIRFDAASGNATFDYEEAGKVHHVWLLDAASAWNQLRAVHVEGVRGVALWRLGSEDPGIWKAFAAMGADRPPDLSAIPGSTDADVEGTGELLRIDAAPAQGRREIVVDKAGLIRGEQYQVLPTPFVVQRTGARPGLIALTFDDGPDPDWTPQILDILKAMRVPATFFVVGENALPHPQLLNRIVEDGHELGNHSYTHPNMALLSARGVRLELNATERLVEAYTGRGMRLFRAPYFGDAEPTTADELGPALAAQQSGYLNVGLHVDPADWRTPGVDAIVQRTVEQVETGNEGRTGNIVLLHDAGGDRSQTVTALPRIIDALRAKGYRFVPVSALAGLSRDQVMPAVEGSDLLAVRADVAIFLALAGMSVALSFLFLVAISVGLLRSLTLTFLALRARDEAPPLADTAETDSLPLISVLIPAFNEARVIEPSVRRVLASSGARLEVIVIDDGSSDGTSAIVERAFADEPRVRLLTLPNAGKARALNRGLELATGEVLVALDADTQFEPETIALLARWFADPAIGAVAGNAKVGNRVNLVTRWQAVEYVTAQNLERRALAGLDAIMVVPGAVGAWRTAALEEVGGYPVNTLAEDQDLTIAIQRAGWKVANDTEAVAWTESPQTLRGLARQRFRWAYGTLQCLWKHRAILKEGRPRGLARIGMPQAWLFQIFFSLVSPLIDLALLLSVFATVGRVRGHGWAQTHTDVFKMLTFWLLFVTVDLLAGAIAYRLDPRERRFPAFLLIAQRFVYRQLMYWVVIRAVAAALHGRWVGWGKLERTGRTTAPALRPAE